MKLTPTQAEIMDRLAPYAGQRVLVLTTVYEAKLPEEAKRLAVGIGFNAAALRGLHDKLRLKVEPIWKGAWVTVPEAPEARTLCNGAQLFEDHANAVERMTLSGWSRQNGEFWVRIKDGRVECAKLAKLTDGRGVLKTLPGLDIPTTAA